jgi:ribosomal protein L11 methyltransferase
MPKGEKRFFRPFQATDRLWTAPPRAKAVLASGQALLELEVGKARGTGIHPATRSCLRLLQDLLSQHLPERALDVGTGSGILALAAARQGVQRVLALDVDPHAVEMARGNVRRNGLREVIKARCRDVRAEGGRYPLVMANLSHKETSRRASAILHCVAPEGWLILGGIWWRFADRALKRFAPPLRVVRREQEAWWVSFLLHRD